MDASYLGGMEAVRHKLGTITLREIALVILCALVIYLLRSRTTYELRPQWRHDLDPELYHNGRFPQQHERLPQSVMTDLDGDGTNDIVLLTNDLHLQVLTVPETPGTATLPHTVVEHSTHLPVTEDELGVPGRPVALATGFLDIYDQNWHQRKQVVLVVLDTWDVLCFDHQLHLLWKKRVLEIGRLREEYKVHSMSVLVSSAVVHHGDRGVVIVGGSFTHKQPGQTPLQTGVSSRPTVKMQQAGRQMFEGPDDPNTHFSTFALSGDNGTLRWHHLPGDFQPKKPKKEPHHWKLGLSQDRGHIGQVHWSKFGVNLLRYLPHHWSDLQHTDFDLAHLQREDISGSQARGSMKPPSTMAGMLGLRDHHEPGVPYGGMLPHSHHEHVYEPNALIQHSYSGIEVLRLSTGHPLTRLPLPDPKSVYIDSNSDGTIERVRAEYSGNKCQMEVTTLQPRVKTLYTGSLCDRASSGLRSLGAMLSPDLKITEDTHLAMAPVAVPSIASHQGMWRHLLGRSIDGVQRGYDSLFLTSTGLLTSFGPDGQHNWQVVVTSQWGQQTEKYKRHDAGSEEGEMYHKAFRPSIQPLSPQIYGTEGSLLTVGWDTMTLIDLQDGYMLAEHSLPCQPLGKPIIGDFNNDGWNDVVIYCPNGYVGFGLSPQPPHLYTLVVSLTVLLTMILLSWCCTADRHAEDDL